MNKQECCEKCENKGVTSAFACAECPCHLQDLTEPSFGTNGNWLGKSPMEKSLQSTKTIEVHPTENGYCCACEYDIAGFENKLYSKISAREEELYKQIEKMKEDDKPGEFGGGYDFALMEVQELLQVNPSRP